ncbi:(d)CMP kinase [Candidatus Syntrophosphaera thermopropionivorans]|uniref:(d)CMP kinase n=1 Tax=Candidatus Syntrophosphaera thermopropionivorans TaxID=2593015 RepID=UPI0014042BEB|nr:(d)CMP kinase [Candidatus Syntrophosphaera thermopropionivorans]
MKKGFIIAIDGPAASGKSTTAQLLAEKLGYVYIDTGAMYRACALKAKKMGIDINDEESIRELLDDIDIRIENHNSKNRIFLDGEDVSEDIRADDISALASAISAIPAVRYKMVELQRKMGEKGGVILDGRDIGTFVFPTAEVKFFLTASPEVRAKRRWLELQQKGINKDFSEVLADLVKRDNNDSQRALAPLKKADDAIEVDTSNITIEEQTDYLYQIIRSRMEEECKSS